MGCPHCTHACFGLQQCQQRAAAIWCISSQACPPPRYCFSACSRSTGSAGCLTAQLHHMVLTMHGAGWFTRCRREITSVGVIEDVDPPNPLVVLPLSSCPLKCSLQGGCVRRQHGSGSEILPFCACHYGFTGRHVTHVTPARCGVHAGHLLCAPANRFDTPLTGYQLDVQAGQDRVWPSCLPTVKPRPDGAALPSLRFC